MLECIIELDEGCSLSLLEDANRILASLWPTLSVNRNTTETPPQSSSSPTVPQVSPLLSPFPPSLCSSPVVPFTSSREETWVSSYHCSSSEVPPLRFQTDDPFFMAIAIPFKNAEDSQKITVTKENTNKELSEKEKIKSKKKKKKEGDENRWTTASSRYQGFPFGFSPPASSLWNSASQKKKRASFRSLPSFSSSTTTSLFGSQSSSFVLRVNAVVFTQLFTAALYLKEERTSLRDEETVPPFLPASSTAFTPIIVTLAQVLRGPLGRPSQFSKAKAIPTTVNNEIPRSHSRDVATRGSGKHDWRPDHGTSSLSSSSLFHRRTGTSSPLNGHTTRGESGTLDNVYAEDPKEEEGANTTTLTAAAQHEQTYPKVCTGMALLLLSRAAYQYAYAVSPEAAISFFSSPCAMLVELPRMTPIEDATTEEAKGALKRDNEVWNTLRGGITFYPSLATPYRAWSFFLWCATFFREVFYGLPEAKPFLEWKEAFFGDAHMRSIKKEEEWGGCSVLDFAVRLSQVFSSCLPDEAQESEREGERVHRRNRFRETNTTVREEIQAWMRKDRYFAALGFPPTVTPLPQVTTSSAVSRRRRWYHRPRRWPPSRVVICLWPKRTRLPLYHPTWYPPSLTLSQLGQEKRSEDYWLAGDDVGHDVMVEEPVEDGKEGIHEDITERGGTHRMPPPPHGPSSVTLPLRSHDTVEGRPESEEKGRALLRPTCTCLVEDRFPWEGEKRRNQAKEGGEGVSHITTITEWEHMNPSGETPQHGALSTHTHPPTCCAYCSTPRRKVLFRSSLHPLTEVGHRCSACRRMVCTSCLSPYRCFDPTFAKYPSIREHRDRRCGRRGRRVCKPCFTSYGIERDPLRGPVRYLGALLVFAGLDVVDLAMLGRTVPVFRSAADLCLTEYRAVLHTCEPRTSFYSLSSKTALPHTAPLPSASSVQWFPLGRLLCNSLHLFLETKEGRGRREAREKKGREKKKAEENPFHFPTTLAMSSMEKEGLPCSKKRNGVPFFSSFARLGVPALKETHPDWTFPTSSEDVISSKEWESLVSSFPSSTTSLGLLSSSFLEEAHHVPWLSKERRAHFAHRSSFYLHREPFLLLLRFLSERQLWQEEIMKRVLSILHAYLPILREERKRARCGRDVIAYHAVGEEGEFKRQAKETMRRKGSSAAEPKPSNPSTRSSSSTLSPSPPRTTSLSRVPSHLMLCCSETCTCMEDCYFASKCIEYLLPGVWSNAIERAPAEHLGVDGATTTPIPTVSHSSTRNGLVVSSSSCSFFVSSPHTQLGIVFPQENEICCLIEEFLSLFFFPFDGCPSGVSSGVLAVSKEVRRGDKKERLTASPTRTVKEKEEVIHTPVEAQRRLGWWRCGGGVSSCGASVHSSGNGIGFYPSGVTNTAYLSSPRYGTSLVSTSSPSPLSVLSPSSMTSSSFSPFSDSLLQVSQHCTSRSPLSTPVSSEPFLTPPSISISDGDSCHPKKIVHLVATEKESPTVWYTISEWWSFQEEMEEDYLLMTIFEMFRQRQEEEEQAWRYRRPCTPTHHQGEENEEGHHGKEKEIQEEHSVVQSASRRREKEKKKKEEKNNTQSMSCVGRLTSPSSSLWKRSGEKRLEVTWGAANTASPWTETTRKQKKSARITVSTAFTIPPSSSSSPTSVATPPTLSLSSQHQASFSAPSLMSALTSTASHCLTFPFHFRHVPRKVSPFPVQDGSFWSSLSPFCGTTTPCSILPPARRAGIACKKTLQRPLPTLPLASPRCVMAPHALTSVVHSSKNHNMEHHAYSTQPPRSKNCEQAKEVQKPVHPTQQDTYRSCFRSSFLLFHWLIIPFGLSRRRCAIWLLFALWRLEEEKEDAEEEAQTYYHHHHQQQQLSFHSQQEGTTEREREEKERKWTKKECHSPHPTPPGASPMFRSERSSFDEKRSSLSPFSSTYVSRFLSSIPDPEWKSQLEALLCFFSSWTWYYRQQRPSSAPCTSPCPPKRKGKKPRRKMWPRENGSKQKKSTRRFSTPPPRSGSLAACFAHWVTEYCLHSTASSLGHPTASPSPSSSSSSASTSFVVSDKSSFWWNGLRYFNLPAPMPHPFQPDVILRSVAVEATEEVHALPSFGSSLSSSCDEDLPSPSPSSIPFEGPLECRNSSSSLPQREHHMADAKACAWKEKKKKPLQDAKEKKAVRFRERKKLPPRVPNPVSPLPSTATRARSTIHTSAAGAMWWRFSTCTMEELKHMVSIQEPSSILHTTNPPAEKRACIKREEMKEKCGSNRLSHRSRLLQRREASFCGTSHRTKEYPAGGMKSKRRRAAQRLQRKLFFEYHTRPRFQDGPPILHDAPEPPETKNYFPLYEILFKASSVEKDQFMCLSAKLLQKVLWKDMANLSCQNSAAEEGGLEERKDHEEEEEEEKTGKGQGRDGGETFCHQDTLLSSSSSSFLTSSSSSFPFTSLRLVLPSYRVISLPWEMGVVEKVSGITLGTISSITEYLLDQHLNPCRTELETQMHHKHQSTTNKKGDGEARPSASHGPLVSSSSFRVFPSCPLRDVYEQSTTFFLVLNYLFAIGDRHEDNVMLHRDGALFHIDFGYVLTEKTVMERLSGVAIRLDDKILSPLLSAVTPWKKRSRPARKGSFSLRSLSTTPSSTKRPEKALHVVPARMELSPSPLSTKQEIVEALFYKAATWYLHALPHADLFCQLWRGCHSTFSFPLPPSPPYTRNTGRECSSPFSSSPVEWRIAPPTRISRREDGVPLPDPCRRGGKTRSTESGTMNCGVEEWIPKDEERHAVGTPHNEETTWKHDTLPVLPFLLGGQKKNYERTMSGVTLRGTIAVSEREERVIDRFNQLFDRHTAKVILQEWFVNTMRSCMNKYRLTDMTRQLVMNAQQLSNDISRRAANFFSYFFSSQ